MDNKRTTNDRHRLWRFGADVAMTGMAAGTVALVGLNPFSLLMLAAIPVTLVARAASERVEGVNKFRRLMTERNLDPLPATDPLARRVAALAARMDMPAPLVYLSPPRLGTISAYTTGAWSMRASRAALVNLPATFFSVTADGRPPVFNEAEQDAIIAHELIHIRNNDFRRMMFNGTLRKVGFIAMMGAMVGGTITAVPLAVAAVAGVCVMLPGIFYAEMMATRRTELITDSESVAVTRDPAALASALEKIYRIDQHYCAFMDNARDITRMGLEQYETITFRPHVIPAPPAPPLRISFLRAVHLTHPDPVTRYRNLQGTAQSLNLPPLPDAPLPPAMHDLLQRTDDGIILPPFTIAASVQRHGQSGRITVETARPFNRAAAPALPPVATSPRGPAPRS